VLSLRKSLPQSLDRFEALFSSYLEFWATNKIKKPCDCEKNLCFERTQRVAYDRHVIVKGDREKFLATVYDTKYKNMFVYYKI
jgi:hypothetical protein